MIEVGTLILMGVFAALAIHSPLIRLSVIYLAVFSLLAAFLYVLFAAPELAIAEAVIGSGLVTLLYLAALKRSHVYTIGVVTTSNVVTTRNVVMHSGLVSDRYAERIERSKAVQEIRDFFIRREFETQLVFLTVPTGQALLDPAYDLVLAEDGEDLVVYTDEESYVMVELELVFQMHDSMSKVKFIRYSPEAVL
ncbi:MAG: DUF4040 domain-containing protein [Spirochaetaceae bacterium]|nr:MAG: DUF4040 domain-containing protein [Spirochaetaceae bacterium]